MFAACPFSLPGYEPSAVGAKLLAPTSGWFFIRILISLTASEASAILSPANITLGPADLAMAGIYRKYLTRDQVLYLQSQPEFQVYEVPVETKGASLKRETMLLSDDLVPKKYVVRGIPGWQPDHDNVTILGRWTDELYVVEALSEEHLVSDRNVSSVFDYIPRSLTNRYTNGFLRSGQQTLTYTTDYVQTLSPERYQYDKLTGKDQVICVVDSGLDPSHPFFVHNKETYGYPGKYNQNMRKVVFYHNYGDGTDEVDGHGTHVAGTIAGYTVDGNVAIQRYGGMAHEAKLYVVDVMRAGSEYLESFDPALVAANMKAIPNCRISSNSWGSDQSDPRSTQTYSVLAAYYTDQLYVFAAGNSEHWVNSPGDSHNVLSVAAISSLPASTATKFIFSMNQAFGNVVIEAINGGAVTRFDGREVSTNQYNYYMYRPEMFDGTQQRFMNITGSNIFVKEGTTTASEVNEQAKLGKQVVILINSQSVNVPDEVSIPVIQTSQDVRAVITDQASVSFYAGPSKNTDYKVSRAYFSSQGPSYYGTDGPDIAAPGEYIFSARSTGGEAVYDTTFSKKISMKSGTSMATPAISGLAALVRQHLLGTGLTSVPSTLLRAVLINSAESYGLPRTQVGHGIPCLKTIVDVPMLHHSSPIGAASHKKYTVKVTKGSHPLRVTLSYLDQPLNLAESADKIYPFFYDLDLIVISPAGKVYHGNEMVDSFATNEKVIVATSALETGNYEIHITSTNPGSSALEDNYSVVVSGDIDTSANFQPTDVTDMCIDNCNGHGTCSSGHCTCNSGWIGKYCEKEIKGVTEGGDFKDTFEHKDIHYYQFKRREDKNYVQIEYENEDSKRQPILHAVYACLSATPSYVSLSNWLCIRAPGNHVWLGWHKNSMNMTDDIYMAMWVVSNYTTTLKVTYTDEDELHTGGLPAKTIAIISGVVIGVVVIAIIVVVILVWRARS